MCVRVLREGAKNYELNICSFISHLAKTIIQILLAPIIALLVAILVEACKSNLCEASLFEIITECIHNDILYSILGIVTIILWEYFVFKSNEKSYFNNNILKVLAGIALVVCFILTGAAIYYRFKPDIVVKTMITLFDYVEAGGLSICIILQCMSNPERYLGVNNRKEEA